MAVLKITQGQKTSEITFTGERKLSEVLLEAGYRYGQPCGGRGTCGKCAVELAGEVSEPNLAEQKAGMRLCCQAVLLGDARAILPVSAEMKQIEVGEKQEYTEGIPMEGRYGAAIDIGTTTLALQLYDLAHGRCVGSAAGENPQTVIAADVMGRIDAAMRGKQFYLQELILKALAGLLERACGEAGIAEEEIDVLVISGNTTMLYLLTGRNPVSLSCAPFEADYLFDEEVEVFGKKSYLPPCMHAFVGADITTAALSAKMCEKQEVSLLCDIGTNGEIALWKDGTLYVTSTAAGPAFEGAGISCGCGSITGAIDKVWLANRELKVHTIGDAPAVGICGSGLIDAIAVMLELGVIEETGAMEEEAYELTEGIFIRREDVRAVQLAKAAIAAGIETVLELAGVKADEIAAFYLAGGFGSHLNVGSMVAIGLIPAEIAPKVRVLGNASLAGAVELLLCRDAARRAREIAKHSVHVTLGGNEVFQKKYIDKMFFEG